VKLTKRQWKAAAGLVARNRTLSSRQQRIIYWARKPQFIAVMIVLLLICGFGIDRVIYSGTAPHTARVTGSSLTPLPANTNLTGSEAVAWADAALTALGAPDTAANVRTLVDWFANEGAPHDLNNPLNLNTPYRGSTISTADGDPSYIHIQAYPVPADFVAAFRLQLNNGSYPAIVAALKAGTGLEGSAATPEIASELSVYSGGGYASIPAAYCPCS
jgi:hypothetical protein